MPDSSTPCYDPDVYVGQFEEELPMGENIGDFDDLHQDEIAAARLAEPDADGFWMLSQIEVDEARHATRLVSLFDIAGASRAALDAINSVSVTLADEALAFAEKVSSTGNGYGIFEVKESDEELLDELSQLDGDGDSDGAWA